jgi:hypothetical protein
MCSSSACGPWRSVSHANGQPHRRRAHSQKSAFHAAREAAVSAVAAAASARRLSFSARGWTNQVAERLKKVTKLPRRGRPTPERGRDYGTAIYPTVSCRHRSAPIAESLFSEDQGQAGAIGLSCGVFL